MYVLFRTSSFGGSGEVFNFKILSFEKASKCQRSNSWGWYVNAFVQWSQTGSQRLQ